MTNKVMNRIEREVFNTFVKNEIGDIGYYVISDKNHVLFTIDYEKISKKYKDKPNYKLNLPNIYYLREKIKSFYPFFDEEKINDIVYVLRDSEFNNQVEINTNSDLIIHNCKFNKGIIVKKAKRVSLTSEYYLNHNYNTSISASKFIINSYELTLDKCNLTNNYNEGIYFNVKKINFNNSNLISSGNINIKAQQLNVIDSVIDAQYVLLDLNRMKFENSKLVGNKLVSINNKNCTSIENVYAPKILYNGIDVTQPEEIQLPKARLQLIEKLIELKDKCNEGIIEETINYQESLEKQPLSKRLKK